jgi:hypothetical protein
MGRAQELFDQATERYDDAIKLLKNLDQLYQDAANKSDPSRGGYDPKITLAQFDWILQAILLSQSLIDGDFHRLEQQFVDKITDYGDLLTYIKKKTNGDLALTWESIAHLNADTQRKLVVLLPKLLDETCDSFVGPLALVEAALEDYDFLGGLVKIIGDIGANLAQVDGCADPEEAQFCAVMAKNLLVDRWNKKKREL